MGAIVKPTASALQLAALTAENIRNSASQHAAQALQPVRLPRQMDSWRPLAPYSRAMAAAQAALREADGGRWAGEVGGGDGRGEGAFEVDGGTSGAEEQHCGGTRRTQHRFR